MDSGTNSTIVATCCCLIIPKLKNWEQMSTFAFRGKKGTLASLGKINPNFKIDREPKRGIKLIRENKMIDGDGQDFGVLGALQF